MNFPIHLCWSCLCIMIMFYIFTHSHSYIPYFRMLSSCHTHQRELCLAYKLLLHTMFVWEAHELICSALARKAQTYSCLCLITCVFTCCEKHGAYCSEHCLRRHRKGNYSLTSKNRNTGTHTHVSMFFSFQPRNDFLSLQVHLIQIHTELNA